MLKIKLSRTGKKHQPSYRIVVAERRSKRDGKFVALLGHFNPLTSPSTIVLDTKSYDEWLAKGAQPTNTVRAIRAKADGVSAKISPKTSGIAPKASKVAAKKKKAQEAAKAEPQAAQPDPHNSAPIKESKAVEPTETKAAAKPAAAAAAQS